METRCMSKKTTALILAIVIVLSAVNGFFLYQEHTRHAEELAALTAENAALRTALDDVQTRAAADLAAASAAFETQIEGRTRISRRCRQRSRP